MNGAIKKRINGENKKSKKVVMSVFRDGKYIHIISDDERKKESLLGGQNNPNTKGSH